MENGVSWDYFDRFNEINEKYLPVRGEGFTMATQIVTAVNKLVYKWYNDRDVFDNTYFLEGWANNLSSYANWLNENVEGVSEILNKIKVCKEFEDYENLLKELADKTLEEKFLFAYNQWKSCGTIYKCDGPFRFDNGE